MVLNSGSIVIPQWPDENLETEYDFTHSGSPLQQFQSPRDDLAGMQQFHLPADFANETTSNADSPGSNHTPYMSNNSGPTSTASPDSVKSKFACPLTTGLTKECVPEFCGVDAPCLSGVTQFPEIEDGDLTPCLERVHPFGTMERVPLPDNDNSTSSTQKEASGSGKPYERRRKPSVSRSISQPAGAGPVRRSETAPKGRQAHSLVERKYRENLNAKIDELHDALQNIQQRRNGAIATTQFQTLAGSGKARKSDILSEALNYIYQSQVDMRHMADEIQRLKGKAKKEETLSNCDDCSLRKQVLNLRLLADT